MVIGGPKFDGFEIFCRWTFEKFGPQCTKFIGLKLYSLANYILIFVFKHQSISGLILQALNLYEKIIGKEKNVHHERDSNLGP